MLRLTISPENIDVRIPIDSVTANPFTGPDPMANRITATNRVVMLADHKESTFKVLKHKRVIHCFQKVIM